MANMSKRVTEGKAEHSRLTEKVSTNECMAGAQQELISDKNVFCFFLQGTQLQKDLKKDELDMLSKQKQLKAAKQDYTTLQKQLKTRLKTLQVRVLFAVVRRDFMLPLSQS